jgi:prepilin-type N-terminal cleavage/methylation domain-containing protein
MFTRARPPVREARLQLQAPTRAFTLIELLTVISIIAILSAISLNVVKGVKERSSIGLAKAELAALSQALEMYKLQYGDYPQTGNATNASLSSTAASTTDAQGILFNALTGKRGPTAAEVKIDGKSFIDTSRFSLQVVPSSTDTSAGLPLAGKNTVANGFVDPWGNRYLYYYKTGTSAQWNKTPSYILLSVGPDETTGIDTVLTDGSVTLVSTGVELDDIYANK